MTTRAVDILINGKNNSLPAINSTSNALDHLRGSLIGVKSAAVGVLAGLSLGKLGREAIGTAKSIITLTASMENTKIAFSTMLGGMDQANKMLADLKKFGAETPYEFPELADATKKLIAFGVEQQNILPTLRRVGDIASGLGIPIGELAELYGKAKVQGRLFAEDVNQLTGRGIPVIQQFARQFGVADSEVKKLVEAGKIGFPQLEKAFVDLTSEGAMFFNTMENRSQGLEGQWSAFNDAVRETKENIGEALLPAMKLVNVALKDMAESAKVWSEETKSGNQNTLDSLEMVAGAIAGIADVWDLVKYAFQQVQVIVLRGINDIAADLQSLLYIWNVFAKDVGFTGFGDMEKSVGVFRDTLKQSTDEIEKSLEGAFTRQTSGEKIRAYFEDLRNKVKEGEKKLAENLASEQDLGGSFVGVGTRIGNSIIEGISKAVKASGLDINALLFGNGEKGDKKTTGFVGGFKTFMDGAKKLKDDMNKQLNDKAKSIIEQNMTPREKFDRDIRELDGLLALNKLSPMEYARERARLAKELEGERPVGTPAVESRFLTRAPGHASPMDKLNMTTAQVAKAVETHRQFLAVLPKVQETLDRILQGGGIIGLGGT